MTYAISYNPSRSFSSLIKKKANRLLLPFLMVTLFLSIPFKYISGYWDKSSDIFSDIFLGQILLFGNSHLWFIASLFIITITFTLLLRNGIFESHKITAIIVLVCISYMGLFLARTGQYFGIPGALKFMIFFVAGFYGLNRIRKFETGILFVIVGWIMTFALYIITNHISTYIKGFGTFMYLPLALAGCVNMVATAKILLKSSMLQKMYFYKSLRKYNYEIYLYSDPFNYLLISVFILMFGDRVLTGDLFSLTAFITRILFTILFAYVVIFMINKIAVISKSLGIKK